MREAIKDEAAANGVHHAVPSTSARSPPSQVALEPQGSGRKQAWAASASGAASEERAPARITSSQSRVTGDSNDDGSDLSEEEEVVDASELRRRVQAASASTDAAAGAGARDEDESSESVGTGRRAGTAPSKAEFEKSVQDEQLERSDFTIFTHDLKKTCDGYYNAVKANLPSIKVEEVTDDDDDDDAMPVFSNLQVNEQGEYVGRLQVGPLLSENESERIPSPASASPSDPGIAEPPVPTHSDLPPSPKPARAPISITAPSMDVGGDSSDDEMEEVIDASELRRSALSIGARAAGEGTKSAAVTGAPAQERAQHTLESDIAVLQRAEAALQSAMRGRAGEHAPSAAGRGREEAAQLDAKVAEAVRKDPALSAEFEAMKGIALADKGEHAKAIEHLSAAIQGAGLAGVAVAGAPAPARPENAVAWLVLRGKCYLELGECFNAVPDLEKAVALDECAVDARLEYAKALRFSGQYLVSTAAVSK